MQKLVKRGQSIPVMGSLEPPSDEGFFYPASLAVRDFKVENKDFRTFKEKLCESVLVCSRSASLSGLFRK